MCVARFISINMDQGVDLAALYVDDVIYWVPADRPMGQVQEAPEEAVDSVYIPNVTTPWLIVGEISDLEKSRLSLIFSAPPMVLPATNWSVLDPTEIQVSLVEFVEKTSATRYVFLGEHSFAGLQAQEVVGLGDSKVYYFPRFISTLTDDEKPLKMAFWNALKSLM
jgi:hypothetical protein